MDKKRKKYVRHNPKSSQTRSCNYTVNNYLQILYSAKYIHAEKLMHVNESFVLTIFILSFEIFQI